MHFEKSPNLEFQSNVALVSWYVNLQGTLSNMYLIFQIAQIEREASTINMYLIFQIALIEREASPILKYFLECRVPIIHQKKIQPW